MSETGLTIPEIIKLDYVERFGNKESLCYKIRIHKANSGNYIVTYWYERNSYVDDDKIHEAVYSSAGVFKIVNYGKQEKKKS